MKQRNFILVNNDAACIKNLNLMRIILRNFLCILKAIYSCALLFTCGFRTNNLRKRYILLLNIFILKIQ